MSTTVKDCRRNAMPLSRRNFFCASAAISAAASVSGVSAIANAEEVPDSQKPLTATDLDRPWIFEVPPEPIAEDRISRSIDTEVLIIGGGPAGFVAAASAAEAGARVVLISKDTAPVTHGGEYFAFSSAAINASGVEVEDSTKLVASRIRDNAYRVDQAKWYELIKASPEAMDWLDGHMKDAGFTTAIGESFIIPSTGETLVYGGTHSWTSEKFPFATDGSGVIDTLYNLAVDNGVDVRFSVSAEQLERSEGGRVKGAIALDGDGNYVRFTASKGVVLATGDFTADKDMKARYAPDYRHVGYGGVYGGDGHKMALWIGAAWQRTFPCGIMAGMLAGNSASFSSELPCFSLTVNTKGMRYANECATNGGAALMQLRQPDGMAICIWDADYGHAAPGPWLPSWARGNDPDTLIDEWKQAAQSDPVTIPGAPPTTTIMADTIEELAQRISDEFGTDPAVLVATVERYNMLCQAGVDEDFGKPTDYLQEIKTGPFFARFGGPSFLIVTGGLRTDTAMHVLDASDNAIPGLYAAGTVVGDMFDNYDFAVGGIHLGGLCLTFGRMAGLNVAAEQA